jgi:hypothetical protein
MVVGGAPRTSDQCIGIYVRHGDKQDEMPLMPLERYQAASDLLLGRMASYTKGKPYIFIGSEDPEVMSGSLQWGEANHWHVQYTNLIDRNTLSARLARPDSEFFHPEVAAHHDLEYVSMIWNLEQSVKCHAWYADGLVVLITQLTLARPMTMS